MKGYLLACLMLFAMMAIAGYLVRAISRRPNGPTSGKGKLLSEQEIRARMQQGLLKPEVSFSPRRPENSWARKPATSEASPDGSPKKP